MIKIGAAHILTIIFVILKLTETITWSWWLVLLPSLIPVVIGAVLLFFGLTVIGVAGLNGQLKVKNNEKT